MNYFKTVPFLALVLFIVGCSEPIPAGTISPKDFKRALSKIDDLQLIDVRTPGEFNGGHIQDAVNLNYFEDNFRTEIEKLDKSRPVAVYCAVGGRSGSAMNLLKELGFEQIYDLDGGITSWEEQKFETVND